MNNDTPQSTSSEHWVEELRARLVGTVIVVGIGRADAGDDGAGPAVIAALAGRTCAKLIDAGVAPENFTGSIARLHPGTVILVDAVAFAGAPGQVRLFEPSGLDQTDFTTHALSPRTFLDYLTQRTGARCLVLGIQPAPTAPAREMSPAMRHATRRVAHALATLLPPAS